MPRRPHIVRMRVALFLAVLLFASPALAGKTDPEWNPPARFDHAYSGKLVIHRLPQPQIVDICTKLLGVRSMIRHGCSKAPKDGKCEMWVVDKTYMRATTKSVVRHEIGHCNGWPSNHPG